MVKELKELDIDEVSLVDKAANKKKFFLMKADHRPEDKRDFQKSFHAAVLGALERVMKTLGNIFSVIETDGEMMGDKFRAEMFPTEKVKSALKALKAALEADEKPEDDKKPKDDEEKPKSDDDKDDGKKMTPEEEKEIQDLIDENQKVLDGSNAEDDDPLDIDSVNENIQAANDLAEELETTT